MRRREREAPAPTPTPGRQSLSLMWSLMSATASEFRAHGRCVSRIGPVLVPTGYPADFQSVPVRRPILHGAHFIWSSTWVAYVAYIIHKAVRPTDVWYVSVLDDARLTFPSVEQFCRRGPQSSDVETACRKCPTSDESRRSGQ
ncbi:hypothetical protein AcW1_007948 [Taiwanofungus camphoratus]|nr:hypothetical protein AcW1_007948 [Antrodia cinnamomea]